MIMELWDVYDKHRRHKGFTITRGKERLGEGEYHLTAHVCVFANDGRMVVQRRASAKPLWPDKWDISASGSVLAGETTAKGAERELYEELGIKASLAEEQPRMTLYHENCISDYYIIKMNVDTCSLITDTSEVSSVMLSSREDILSLIDEGAFVPYKKGFINFLFDMNESKDRNAFDL